MRRLDLTFTALLVPLDFLGLILAALTAYGLRLSKAFQEIRPLLQAIPLPDYLSTAAAFALVWLVFYVMAGLYAPRYRKPWSELSRIILVCTAGIMIVIAVVFFQRQVTTSRFLILAVWGLSILYTWFGRLILRILRHAFLRAGIGHQRIVIIGQGKTAQDLMNFYRAKKQVGYTVIKSIKSWSNAAEKELDTLTRRGALDGVLLADPDFSKDQALEIIEFCETHHVGFHYLADLFAARFTNIEVSTTNGVPLIDVKRTPLDGWGRIAKRLFDLTASGILLIIFSPIMILTALAVALTSPGGVFFSRLPDGSKVLRVGEGGRSFHYFKFRSMYQDRHWERYNELAKLNLRKGDPLVKTKNDPRITPVGRFIRKWSIDELPELILVFLGRMSLVGPRPHYPEEVAKYQPHHRRALGIKPGITGIAQISGRSDLDFEEEVRLDTWYIQHWSFWRDILILLKTPWAVVTHRGVEEGV